MRCDSAGCTWCSLDADEREVEESGRGAIELAHALGVHELGTDLEAHEEAGGHALASFVEVLDEVRVRAHGHDEVGAAFEREQQGEVLAGGGKRPHGSFEAEL